MCWSYVYPYCLKVNKSFMSMIKCTWLVHDKITIYVCSHSSIISDVFCWSFSVVTSSCSCFKVLLILSCSSSLSVSSSAPGWCETKCSGITALWTPGFRHTFWAPCQHNKISTLDYMSTHSLVLSHWVWLYKHLHLHLPGHTVTPAIPSTKTNTLQNDQDSLTTCGLSNI